MADRLKGITIEIGGDTTGLSKALKGVNNEIRQTQADLRDVERLLKLDPGNVTLLEQKQRLLSNAVDETKRKLDSLREAEKQAQQQFKDGKVSQEQYDGLQREIAATESSLKSLETAQKNVSKEMSNSLKELQGKFQTVGDKMTDIGKKWSVVSAGIVAAGGKAVDTAAEFEQKMDEVAAVSGANAEQMAQLNELAMELGADTKFSASEAADGLLYMAQAGWTTDDMLNGLKGVMDLAAASGEELGESSDIVTNALTAFGLTASDSARFADVLAQAAASSNTDVHNMGETFKYVAPVAGALGYSIEDTAVAIGLMANSGIKGSEAGTSLRAALTRMANPVENADRAMQALNLSLTNADGSMKPLSEIMDQLRSSFSGLTQEEQVQYAAMLAGQEAMSGLLAIVNASDESYQALSEQIKNSAGAADEMAQIMQGNFRGQTEELGGKVETLAIQMGNILIPVLGNVVDAIGNVVEWFSNLNTGAQVAVVAFAAIVAGVGPLLVTIGQISTGIGALIPVISTLSTTVLPALKTAFSSVFSFIISNPIALLIAAITALVVLIATKGDEIQNVLNKVNDFLQGAFAKDWEEVFGPVLGGIINGFMELFSNAWDTLHGLLDGIIDVIRGIVTGDGQRIADGALKIVETLVFAAGNTISSLAEGIKDILKGLDDWLQSVFKTDWTEIFGPGLGDILNAFFKNFENIWNGAKDILDGLLTFISGVFSGDWGKAWEGVVQIFEGIWELLVAAAKAPLNGIIALLNMAISGINDLIYGLNGISFDIPDWLGGGSFGFDIPTIPKIPLLAKGGVVRSGSAIVGEAGPELLTVMGDRAVVTPLSGQGARGGRINITLNNSFGTYDSAAANQISRDLVRAVNRALGRTY